MLEQPARLGNAQLHVITLWRGTQLLPEQALELSARTPCVNRQLLQLQGLFQVGVHQLHHLTQRGAHADVFRRFYPSVARFLKREDVFDALDQRFVMQALDPVQRHVEGP
ncbi:hypothetical protein D3C84_1071050 [compost metagenome]